MTHLLRMLVLAATALALAPSTGVADAAQEVGVAIADPAPTVADAVPALLQTGIIRRPADGFAMQLPADFRLLSSTSGRHLAGSATLPGLLMVVPRLVLEDGRMESFITDGWTDPEGALTPQGTPRAFETDTAKGVAIEVVGTYLGRPVQGMAVMLRGDDGRGVVGIATASVDKWADLEPHAREFIDNLELLETDHAPVVRGWNEQLTGRMLVRLAAGDPHDGVVEVSELHLCEGGRFKWARWSDAADGRHLEETDFGRWAVRPKGAGVEMELTRPDGARLLMPMEARDGQLHMDNTRWYRINGRANCEGE